MKRVFTIISLIALMVACDVGPRQTNAKEFPNYYIGQKGNSGNINVTVYELDGIEYRIFNSYGSGSFVVNHTKEVLDVKLKQEMYNQLTGNIDE